MIKFEYKPVSPESNWDLIYKPAAVESVTMTLSDGISWDEATIEFHNFLRAVGYVIPYDFEDDEENEKYEFKSKTKNKEDLVEIVESSMQEKMG